MAKYYVVTKGHKTGIFNTWEECKEQVNGFKDAKYKSFNNLEEAEFALKNNLDIGLMIAAEYQENDKPIDGICVDGACSGNPGIGEYRYVFTGGGMEIFKSKKYINVTNNIMEFLGLVDAIKYALKHKINVIYTDSVTAMAWVRNKECNTQLNKDNIVFKEIEAAIDFLKTVNYLSIKIIKWDTKKYGEIPADFNRK